RVGVMEGGRLEQVGTPQEVYERPRTAFVAKFLGDANLIPGELLGRPGELLMARPERCVVGPAAERCSHVWTGRVVEAAFLGADAQVVVAVAEDLTLRVRMRALADRTVSAGEGVQVGVPAEALWAVL